MSLPLILNKREPHLVEEMDKPDCDQAKLFNTYRQFASVNRLVSRWNVIYRRFIKPALSTDKKTSLLDIGHGGGDLPLYLYHRASNDGFQISITGIETDSRSIQFTDSLVVPENISFEYAATTDLINQNRQFDIVLSNHLLHHLKHDQLITLLDEASRLSRKMVVFNDIERGDFAWLLFRFLRPFYRNSFIVNDGLLSIRRSFTKNEIESLLPSGWIAKRIFPYRFVVILDHE